MTLATPTTTPNSVRIDRNLLAQSDCRAILTASLNSIASVPGASSLPRDKGIYEERVTNVPRYRVRVPHHRREAAKVGTPNLSFRFQSSHSCPPSDSQNH